MRGRDRETRERLIEAAARLFAERGFSKVTVRDICRSAGANVAAVNYHFGGKTGLYREIVWAAIRTMQTTTDAIRRAGDRRPPEEQLAAFIKIFLARVVESRDSRIHQLMLRELSDPTPALDLVARHVVHPRLAYLRRVVTALLGRRASEATVEHCVMSVQSQCLALLNGKVATRLQPRVITGRRLDALAEHITTFSLAGIRGVTSEGKRGRLRRSTPHDRRGRLLRRL